MAGSDHTESSGTNSVNKQADTGYEGSVSSGPSMTTLVRKSTANSESSSTTNVYNIPNADVPVTQTVSHESNPGRLSVVVSVDEQSSVQDVTAEDQTKTFSDGATDNSLLQDTVANGGKLETVQDHPIDENNAPSEHLIEHSDDKNGNISDPNDSLKTKKNLHPPHSNSNDNPENPTDTTLTNGPVSEEHIAHVDSDFKPVDSNVIVVANSHVLSKSGSVSSLKQVVNISSSSDLNNGGITAIE